MLNAKQARDLALDEKREAERVARHGDYITRLIEGAARDGKTSLILNGYIDESNPVEFFAAVRMLCEEHGFKTSDSYVNKTMQHLSLGRPYIHYISWD